jgi:hypothetical protein
VEASWPSFDGVYVHWPHLSGPPELAQPASYHLDGRFHRRERTFELNPAVWKLLGDRGVAVRGPVPSGLQVWADRAALTAWTVENLNGYWVGLLERVRALPAERMDARLAVWGVLGVARLHYTLVTGEITSKSGAGSTPLRGSRTGGVRSFASPCASGGRSRVVQPG